MRIGVDLGGTKTEVLALAPGGAELARRRQPTPAGDYAATLDSIARLVNELERETGQTGSVGVCIPGTLSPDSGLVKNANSTCLIGHPLDRDLALRLNRPVRVANDADCFALSEATDGAGQGADCVFGVILGTGVGGGLVIGQRLLAGPNAIAGEWGHNPLPWYAADDGAQRPCYCGKQGCIETFLSGPGLIAHYVERLQRAGVERLQRASMPAATAIDRVEAILARSSQGDPVAQEALARYCEQLAKALASVINILDPAVIVLGGGLSNLDLLYREVPRRWGRYVFSDRVHTRLARPQHGDASGVRGAAWLWP